MILISLINSFNFFDNQSFVQLYRSAVYLIIGFAIFIGIKTINKQEEYYKNYFIVFYFVNSGLIGIFTLISGLNFYFLPHQITSVILVFSVLKPNHKLS